MAQVAGSIPVVPTTLKDSMQTSNKSTVKSCSCQQCRRGKASVKGAVCMKQDERSNRRFISKLLKVLDDDYESEYNLSQLHKGNYYD